MSRFFRRRSLNIKVVKDQDPANESNETQDIFEGVAVAEAYAEIAKDFITHTALIIGGVWIACKIVERICK